MIDLDRTFFVAFHSTADRLVADPYDWTLGKWSLDSGEANAVASMPATSPCKGFVASIWAWSPSLGWTHLCTSYDGSAISHISRKVAMYPSLYLTKVMTETVRQIATGGADLPNVEAIDPNELADIGG